MKKGLKYLWKIQLVRAYLWCITDLSGLWRPPALLKTPKISSNNSDVPDLQLILLNFLFKFSYKTTLFFCRKVMWAWIKLSDFGFCVLTSPWLWWLFLFFANQRASACTHFSFLAKLRHLATSYCSIQRSKWARAARRSVEHERHALLFLASSSGVLLGSAVLLLLTPRRRRMSKRGKIQCKIKEYLDLENFAAKYFNGFIKYNWIRNSLVWVTSQEDHC